MMLIIIIIWDLFFIALKVAVKVKQVDIAPRQRNVDLE